MKNKVLVTGGAGYIGSHVVRQLCDAGYDIVVYDNLSTGSAEAVLFGQLIIGDLADRDQLTGTFAKHHIDAVVHLAASLSVPESIQQPLDYYANNTLNTLNLLQCCHAFGVNKFVFSSTAAVYGEPDGDIVQKSSPTRPMNPYGRSKLMSEQIIRDLSQVSPLRHVILRYFNVAGADSSGRIGQSSKKSEHLVKIACDAALGRRPFMEIFGTDYPTPDGTGIRDYIHVEDLATAHLDALRCLETQSENQTLNCGYGCGYSVRQVIDQVKAIAGVDFVVKESPRRAGDPASVVACADKIRAVLGWKPRFNRLETIIRSALAWEKHLMAASLIPSIAGSLGYPPPAP